MTSNPVLVIPVMLVLISACTHRPIGEMQFPGDEVQHVVHANSISWKPCPPGLPAGCEGIAILEGHPKKADLFTVRFKLAKGFKMPAHTHPKDERVTIFSGKMSVAFGESATHDNAASFGPGDYYVNAREAVHVVWADEDTVLQITGIGPWKVNFVNRPE